MREGSLDTTTPIKASEDRKALMSMIKNHDENKAPLHQIRQIKQWFSLAVPAPTEQNISTQIGVHFEEVSEMLTVLAEAGTTFSDREQLAFVTDAVSYVQRRFKEGRKGISVNLDQLDRVELLDALCDQIVTAVGIAHMLDLDIEGALQEVADSNDSKFDENGKPIFNDQMKIMKGPRYFRAELSKFIPHTQAQERP